MNKLVTIKFDRYLRYATKYTREVFAGKRNPERDYSNRRAKSGCPKDVAEGKRGMTT